MRSSWPRLKRSGLGQNIERWKNEEGNGQGKKKGGGKS
jgi:hypothetical protein